MGCSKEVCVFGIVSMFLIVSCYRFLRQPGCGPDCRTKVFKSFAIIAVFVIAFIIKFSKPCGNSEDFQDSGNNSHRRQATTQNSEVNVGMAQGIYINNRPGERLRDDSFVTPSPTGNPIIYLKELKTDRPPKYDPPPDYDECQRQQNRQNSKS